ncbi:MAG: copper amine oxidase [Selenomonadaceae bacterium]|nr:copper amine oxidase [Selenomonadaceae bacterium]
MNLAKKILAAILAAATSLSAFFSAAHAENFPSTVMHKLDVYSRDSGGTLIFSDSPEYVNRNGILYTDTVSGEARILFYHLNNTGVRKRFAIIFENVSDEKNSIKITRGGLSVPNRNYLSVGKITQTMYMQGEFRDKIFLERYERKVYAPDEKYFHMQPGQLIHGICDLVAEKDVRIYLMMYPENADPLEFLNRAEILPKDEYRLRGTFKNMNRTLTLKKPYDWERDGLGYILIGDNVNDRFKTGIDATDGSAVVNYGNYGINYTLNFSTRFMTRFCLSPLGGHYAGALRYKYHGRTGVIQTPDQRLFFGDRTPPESPNVAQARVEGISLMTNTTELSELGNYRGQVSFEYSPPGASNLPINIVLMPSQK